MQFEGEVQPCQHPFHQIVTPTPALIMLNDQQESAANRWAADDRLWTTEDTVRFNLRTFARVILKHADESFRVAHARKQGAADGFQNGWHAALTRISEGDSVETLRELVPPSVKTEEEN